MNVRNYNIRVYGLMLRDDAVLVTDELRDGFPMTKFPGGGHELGEGLADSLRREWREELDQEIEVGELVYVNEFLQVSAFDPRDQVILFYYRVQPAGGLFPAFPRRSAPLPFPDRARNAQAFRWQPLSLISPGQFTFPVDRIVVEML